LGNCARAGSFSRLAGFSLDHSTDERAEWAD
jgi:hypothetical protein